MPSAGVIADRFTGLFLAEVAELRTGDPLDEETRMGPMLDEAAAAKAEDWLREAAGQGARVLCGGKREGALFQPTVVTGTQPTMRVTCEEIFAPVVVLERYADFDRALESANATDYGLQAGVFTNDLDAVYRAYQESSRRWAFIAGMAVGLTVYAYSTFRLLAPLHVAAVLLCYGARRYWRSHVPFVAGAAIPLLRYAVYLWQHFAALTERFKNL